MHNITKLIGIKYHFTRMCILYECVLSNKIDFRYMSSDKIIAGILTKSVLGPKLKDILGQLSLKKYVNKANK